MVQLRVEYAKSGRARCQNKECAEPIESGELRIGTAVLMPGADTPSFKWRHLCCFTKRQLVSVKAVEDIEGLENLKPDDQKLMERMVAGELIGDQSVRACPSTAPPKPKAKRTPKKKAPAKKGKVTGRGPGSDDESDATDEMEEDFKMPKKQKGPKNKWEWQDNKGQWKPLDPQVSKEVDEWYIGGAPTCRVNIGDWEYKIDFDKMIQKNSETGKSRNIRRVPIGGEAPKTPTKPPKTTTTTTTTTSSSSAVEDRDSPMPDADSDEESGGEVVWQWKNDDGKFQAYPIATSQGIEKKFQDGKYNFLKKLHNWNYKFDLNKMVQINDTTGTKRSIRRMKGTKVTHPTKRGRENDDDDDKPAKAHKPTPHASPHPKHAEEKKKGGGEQKKKKGYLDEDEAYKPKGANGGMPKCGVVDKYSGLVDVGSIYSEDGDVFECTLNQTNVAQNNNKFYICQLVESNNGGKWWVWTRWARVGQIGQSKCEAFTSVNAAKTAFCKKFQEKTRNSWYERDDFVKHPGKYQLMEMETSVNPEEAKKALLSVKDKLPDSKLPKRVQSVMEIISDTKMMMKTMADYQIDTGKMPLGKLSKNQIKKGFSILKQLQNEINHNSRHKVLNDLTSEFYTIIPHDFGWTTPKIISSIHEINKKIGLLETLSDLEIATKLLTEAHTKKENPFDAAYEALHTEITPLDRDSYKWQVLVDSVKKTHGPTHTAYTLEVLDIYEVEREGEADRFDEFEQLPNHQYLWHGSRASNLMGILSQGLRIAPPEAPVTGYMFGKGVYFADIVTKSANYCHASKKNDVGLLLLCQVALGKEYKVTQAEYMEKPPKGCHSTMGVGKLIPDPDGDTKLDKVGIACGKPRDNDSLGDDGSALMYNEYIVYDVSQIRVRYMFKFKFHFK